MTEKISAIASLLATRIQEKEVELIYKTFEDAGLLNEFLKYIKTQPPLIIYDLARDFAKLHPEKFHVK